MRCLAAIFLTFWTCVLVPVVPHAAAAPVQAAGCAHCRGSGGCCNHDCAPPPPSAPSVCTLTQVARVTPAQLTRAAQPVRRFSRDFLAAFVKKSANDASLPLAAAAAPPAAGVPLYRAHCSFLI
jgi:hypothetical protein